MSVCKTNLDNQQCANTHADNFASCKHIVYHCQHPLFQAIVAPKLEGSTQLPILVLVMLMVCLQTCGEYMVYNDAQLTLQESARMLICSSDVALQLQGRFLSCLAQLSLQSFCMPQQDMPFGNKSLTFVTRHNVIVFPASWSTSFGSAIGHRLSKVDSIAQFRQREPLLAVVYVRKPGMLMLLTIHVP